MGCLYRRKQKLRSGEHRELPTWWIKYYQGGRAVRESTGTTKETVARRILRTREGDVERGIPIVPQMGKITFDDAADDLLNDYKVNNKRTYEHADRRLTLHLKPAFTGKRLLSISTAAIRAYAAARQTAGAANATVNRELALLKRMFSLAVKDGKLHARPYVPMLREDNTRRGFFEADQFEAVRNHLPNTLRPVVTFAYLTGWRLKSEILPLEWRQVDWQGRVVRLDPGTTKNREGRSFPFTGALEKLLKEQQAEHDTLKMAGRIVPLVFHRDGERIRDFRKAWDTACKAGGCPGRIPHDFRRTAVRNLERAGVPRSAAMAMVGHKTEAIYRRYAIVDSGVLREAAAKIDAANSLTGTISGTTASTHQEPAKAHSA
jgi:integrase